MKITPSRLLSLLFSVLLGSAASGQGYPGYGDDRAEIENLQARYTFAMDFNDPAEYAAVFAEDGVLTWAGGDVVGREAILKFMQDGVYNLSRNAEEAAWPATTRHFIANRVIKVDGDKATAFTYWFQVNNNGADRSANYGLFGHYEDELAKINGQWLFTHRSIFNEGIGARSKAGQPNPATLAP